jgi:type VI secretion system secreted protein Hcp
MSSHDAHALVAATESTASAAPVAVAKAPDSARPHSPAAGSPLVAARQLALPSTLQHPVPPTAASAALAVADPPDIGLTTLSSVSDVCATLVGDDSGQLTGGIMTPGKIGTLKVLGLAHTISSVHNPASGAPSGRTQHEPFVVVLAVDLATPQLYKALATHERLSTVVLELCALPASSGGAATAASSTVSSVPVFRIELTHATIAAMQLGWGNTAFSHSGSAAGGAPLMQQAPTVTVSFVYSKIEWTWVQGGDTATATWPGSA